MTCMTVSAYTWDKSYHSLSDSKCFSRSRRPDHIHVFMSYIETTALVCSALRGWFTPKKLYLLNLKTCLVTHILQNEFFFSMRKKRIQVYWGTVHWTNHWGYLKVQYSPFSFLHLHKLNGHDRKGTWLLVLICADHMQLYLFFFSNLMITLSHLYLCLPFRHLDEVFHLLNTDLLVNPANLLIKHNMSVRLGFKILTPNQDSSEPVWWPLEIESLNNVLDLQGLHFITSEKSNHLNISCNLSSKL